MNMEYKLLDNGKGLILTRQPEIVQRHLFITFSGAPKNATAIFEKVDGDSLYRQLQDDTCGLPAHFLDGDIKVSVTILDGSSNAPKWRCEEIKAQKQESGVLVCPNDMNIPIQMVEIQLEQQKINENINKLVENYSELNKKLEKLLEGYDIT